MVSEDDKIRIEEFVNNDLSEEDRRIVNEKLAIDDLRGEVILQRAVVSSIKNIHENNLRTEFRQLLKDEAYDNQELVFKRNRMIWYAAASVIAAVTIASFLILKGKSDTPTSLFISYYKPYPVGAVTRGNNDDVLTEVAFKAYREREYERAAKSLEILLKNKTEKYKVTYLQLLLGNCYLNLNKGPEAARCFQTASHSSDLLIAQHGQWYYALTLIRIDRIKEANVILNQIINSNSLYANQAKAIAERVKGIS